MAKRRKTGSGGRYVLLIVAVVVCAFASPGNAAATPANDDFDAATPIGSLPFADALDTSGATRAVDDPSSCGFGAETVWYRFAPMANVRVLVSTLSAGTGYLASVYTGSRGSLTQVGCDQVSGSGHLAFDAAAGTTYHLLLTWQAGAANLALSVRPVLPPSNNDFDNAALIGTLPFGQAVATQTATAAPDDPIPSCDGVDQTLWYSITLPQRTRVVLDTLESLYDTTLAVYTSSRGALTEVSCSRDQRYYGMASLGFDAAAGVTYHIMVGGWIGGPGGDWVLTAERGLLSSQLGLALSSKVTDYGHRVAVTAHLGAFGDVSNPIVSIYKTPVGGTKTLVKSGAVDSKGDLTVQLRATKKTTFAAVWDGDERYAAATSPSRALGVKVITTTRLSGNYGRAGKYRLYHVGHNPRQTGKVIPNFAGRRLYFIAQIRSGGAWRQLAVAHFRIRSNGTATAFIVNPPPGLPFRVRNFFAGDAAHLGDKSPWAYFRVTR